MGEGPAVSESGRPGRLWAPQNCSEVWIPAKAEQSQGEYWILKGGDTFNPEKISVCRWWSITRAGGRQGEQERHVYLCFEESECHLGHEDFNLNHQDSSVTFIVQEHAFPALPHFLSLAWKSPHPIFIIIHLEWPTNLFEVWLTSWPPTTFCRHFVKHRWHLVLADFSRYAGAVPFVLGLEHSAGSWKVPRFLESL